MAIAEVRSLTRLPGTWLAWTASFSVGAALFIYHSVAYFANSAYSATYGAIDPRFLASGIGTFALWTAQIGLILFSADIIDRDRRARISDVLGATTATNLELLAGRSVGLVLIAWAPLCAVAASVQIGAVSANFFGWPVSRPMEPTSLAAFLILDSLPTLILCCAITVFLTVALRSRLAAVVVALTTFGLQVWGMFHTPLYLLPVVFGTTGFASIASDVVPRFIEEPSLLQRSCLLFVSAGLLLGAAALHRRRDSATRSPQMIASAVLVASGLAGIAVLFAHASQQIEERDHWAAAHAAQRNDPRGDLERIAGRVRIAPGERLELDVDLVLRTPAATGSAALVFSLNPGMRVQDIRLDGTTVAHEHAAGLLRVLPDPTFAPGTRVVLSLDAVGVPDARFAYLDGVVDPLRRTVIDSQLHVLGTEASLFERDYVALMPGVRWLPAPGPSFQGDDQTLPRRDFFEIDIEVEVPRGWLVAGPGRQKQERSDDSSARFRLRPDTPLPAVGLFAAPFETHMVEVAGVQFTLLLHPKHVANVDALGAAGMATILATLVPPDNHGLRYPDNNLSLVEVPGRLRGYGGGWRMDTLQALPGILLLREYAFPTARLERAIGDLSGDRYGLLQLMARYFSRDFSGGGLLHASRNLVAFHTSAIGEGADALDFLIEELSDRVMGLYPFRGRTDRFFSAHLFALGPSAPEAGMLAAATANTAWIDAAVRREPKRVAVWNDAANTSLVTLGASERPRDTLSLLTLKARARATLIFDLLGRDRATQLLAEIRRRHAGRHFSATDFDTAATDISGSIGTIATDWFHGTSLPGFEASAVEVFRLTDDDEGRPRYQVLTHIHNGESTAGWLRVFCDMGQYDADYAGFSEPVRIDGHTSVTVGMLSLGPPRGIAVIPYLSKNRGSFYLPLPDFDEAAAVDREPHVGTGHSTWRPRQEQGIVVDDLDDGFEVQRRGDAASADWRSWRPIKHDQWVDLDGGLPIPSSARLTAGEWYREEARWGWGRYRRTIARALAGDGDQEAVFTANLPSGGLWRLDYHMPGRTFGGMSGGAGHEDQGRYEIHLEADATETALEFDASVAELGWNHLGDFAVEAGQVRVLVRNRTSGSSVIADAIRWRPARGGAPFLNASSNANARKGDDS